MRAVVDTNILVRAVIKPQGTVGAVLSRLRDGTYTFLYAESTLAELVNVLNQPRIQRKYHISAEDILVVVSLILLRGEAVRPDRQITVCRDLKDNKFLEVAVAGEADVLVSGDKDLLVLDPFEGIPIVEPWRFLELLSAGE